MKKLIALLCALAFLVSGTAMAHSKKKAHRHQKQQSSEPQGGGYYDGKYHGHKKGEAKKPLLRWDGFNDPIKGMKEAQEKPPAKTPSQSTDK